MYNKAQTPRDLEKEQGECESFCGVKRSTIFYVPKEIDVAYIKYYRNSGENCKRKRRSKVRR